MQDIGGKNGKTRLISLIPSKEEAVYVITLLPFTNHLLFVISLCCSVDIYQNNFLVTFINAQFLREGNFTGNVNQ